MTIIAALVLLTGIGIVANTIPRNADMENKGDGVPTENLSGQAQMANPASQTCAAFGYRVDIRKDDNAGEIGYCMFPDGAECEEWSFFRNECGTNWKKGVVEQMPTIGTIPGKIPNEKYAGCPEWVNCMPGFDLPENHCYVPPGCEGYTQKAY